MQDFKETQEYTQSKHNATCLDKNVRTHYLPMFNNKTSNVANN